MIFPGQQPLSRLTEHARRISEGSYGTKIEGFADDLYETADCPLLPELLSWRPFTP